MNRANNRNALWQNPICAVKEGYWPQQYYRRDCAIYTATNAMLIAFGYPIEYPQSDLVNLRYRMAADLLNGVNGIFYTSKPSEAIPKNREQFHYEPTDYWMGDKASSRSRTFKSLNKDMLYFFPDEMQARYRADKWKQRDTAFKKGQDKGR